MTRIVSIHPHSTPPHSFSHPISSSSQCTMPHAPADYTPDSFKVLLKKLVQTPDEFTPEDCALCFRHLCVQGASDAQVGRLGPDWSWFDLDIPFASLRVGSLLVLLSLSLAAVSLLTRCCPVCL